MADSGLIAPEMRVAVGTRSAAVAYEVSRTSVWMFARAVGYRDPIYYDDIDAARAAGYADLPCPPGYLGTPVFQPRFRRFRVSGHASNSSPHARSPAS